MIMPLKTAMTHLYHVLTLFSFSLLIVLHSFLISSEFFFLILPILSAFANRIRRTAGLVPILFSFQWYGLFHRSAV